MSQNIESLNANINQLNLKTQILQSIVNEYMANMINLRTQLAVMHQSAAEFNGMLKKKDAEISKLNEKIVMLEGVKALDEPDAA